jgi:hypothetical protein
MGKEYSTHSRNFDYIRILVQNSEGLPRERTRLIRENNIKIDLKGILLKGMNQNHLVQDQTMHHDNEFFGSIKDGTFLDWLSKI